jgi:hypothetical protein
MADAYRAVETLYHDYLTGLILTTVTRRDTASAADLLFRTFRRQHLEKFLPGLEKLGLTGLPHAIACARYHYLSNQLGGVRVEYFEESSRKAWVRYVPPRWIYPGATICAVPSDVTRAMLRGWHAHNGVTLGNRRLGFVCTKMTTEGQPGLEGYYLEHDRELHADERLRFAPDEEPPDFDPARAPHLAASTWPPERLRKVARNYAMDYVRSVLPELVGAFGADEARRLGGITGRLIGMQDHASTAADLGIESDTAEDFGEYLRRIGRAQGDHVDWARDGSEIVIRQMTWELMRGVAPVPDGVFESWNALWEGALSVHNRRLVLMVTKRLDRGDDAFEWRVQPRRRA